MKLQDPESNSPAAVRNEPSFEMQRLGAKSQHLVKAILRSGHRVKHKGMQRTQRRGPEVLDVAPSSEFHNYNIHS